MIWLDTNSAIKTTLTEVFSLSKLLVNLEIRALQEASSLRVAFS